jgi:hypothetical protein
VNYIDEKQIFESLWERGHPARKRRGGGVVKFIYTRRLIK